MTDCRHQWYFGECIQCGDKEYVFKTPEGIMWLRGVLDESPDPEGFRRMMWIPTLLEQPASYAAHEALTARMAEALRALGSARHDSMGDGEWHLHSCWFGQSFGCSGGCTSARAVLAEYEALQQKEGTK